MQSLDDPYQPTAELARAHLRNAVEIMLEREPVQGKDYPAAERSRLIAALGAIIEMHRPVAEEVLRMELPGICATIVDDKLYRAAHFASKVSLGWDALGPACQGKVNTLIAKGSAEDPTILIAIASALKVPALTEAALNRAKTLPYQSFVKLLSSPRVEYIDRAIQEYRDAGSFRAAERVGQELILPLVSVMEPQHVSSVLRTARNDKQIFDAGGTQDMLGEFFDKTSKHHGTNLPDWQEFLKHVLDLDASGRLGVTHHYSELTKKMEAAAMWPIF